jgi:hypothetical protein
MQPYSVDIVVLLLVEECSQPALHRALFGSGHIVAHFLELQRPLVRAKQNTERTPWTAGSVTSQRIAEWRAHLSADPIANLSQIGVQVLHLALHLPTTASAHPNRPRTRPLHTHVAALVLDVQWTFFPHSCSAPATRPGKIHTLLYTHTHTHADSALRVLSCPSQCEQYAAPPPPPPPPPATRLTTQQSVRQPSRALRSTLTITPNHIGMHPCPTLEHNGHASPPTSVQSAQRRQCSDRSTASVRSTQIRCCDTWDCAVVCGRRTRTRTPALQARTFASRLQSAVEMHRSAAVARPARRRCCGRRPPVGVQMHCPNRKVVTSAASASDLLIGSVARVQSAGVLLSRPSLLPP